ncbi:MAG: sugar ABC transporter substrate-binding protein, partial [Spirochaetaceae bacterium]|nr:sugar ABC transporter substrate-binding protein [Spirochaetaceae bacterium]
MMRKNVLFAVCGLGLILGVFIACNKKADGAGSGGVVTLTFTGWEASPLETEAVKNGIAAFERANPGIKVSYTPTNYEGYLPKVLSSISSNSPPDVFFVAAADYRIFASRDALLDITDRFDAQFPLDDFIDSSRTIMNINGRIYGISSCSVSPVIYYNKDIFDKYNEPYPSADPRRVWTIDEFRAVAKRLTRDGIYGCYGLETNGNMINVQVISGGGRQFSADYNTSTYNSPETKKVLQTIKAIRVEDKSMPSSATLESVGMDATQMLQTGKIAMLLDGSWALQQLSTLDFPVGIAPVPSYGRAVTAGQAHLHSIAKTSKHPEEAWK